MITVNEYCANSNVCVQIQLCSRLNFIYWFYANKETARAHGWSTAKMFTFSNESCFSRTNLKLTYNNIIRECKLFIKGVCNMNCATNWQLGTRLESFRNSQIISNDQVNHFKINKKFDNGRFKKLQTNSSFMKYWKVF